MDKMHHVAITVNDLKRAITWYTENFSCRVSYQDETWAMLDFENIQLALVLPSEHPPHIAFENERAESFGELTTHRDGVRSIYLEDSEGNTVEILDPHSVTSRPKKT